MKNQKDKYADVLPRSAVVAGQFYPAEASELKKQLDSFFENAKPASMNRPISIIAPHAGYMFSGQIAADAFNQVRGQDYDVIVILGANHSWIRSDRISIYPRGGYETPLGLAEIDEEIVEALFDASEPCTFIPEFHFDEHSIEVQIPFVQHLFPAIKIVPILIGYPKVDLLKAFGEILADTLKHRKPLLVASSDLSHYPTYSDALYMDQQTLDAILTLDPFHLHSIIRLQMQCKIPNLRTCACGEGAILATIAAAKKLGANQATVINYANSGDSVYGDHVQVVGYGALALTCEKQA
ncbi:MAG: AmmeMemoRadiSam system protein B [bacterium]